MNMFAKKTDDGRNMILTLFFVITITFISFLVTVVIGGFTSNPWYLWYSIASPAFGLLYVYHTATCTLTRRVSQTWERFYYLFSFAVVAMYSDLIGYVMWNKVFTDTVFVLLPRIILAIIFSLVSWRIAMRLFKYNLKHSDQKYDILKNKGQRMYEPTPINILNVTILALLVSAGLLFAGILIRAFVVN